MGPSPKKIAIYRCVFGGYDNVLDECVVVTEADYYLFTDDPLLEVYPYQRILITSVEGSPAMVNRSLKLTIPKELISYDMTIYVDGNIGIFSSFSPLIKEFLRSNADIGLCTHPNHATVEDEINLCIEKNKSSEKLMREEALFYSESNYPVLGKFSENSIIFRKKPNDNLSAAMSEWLGLVKKFSGRDQLSLPFIRSKYCLTEYFFDFSARKPGNPYCIAFPHNVSFYSSSAPEFIRFKIKFSLKRVYRRYLFFKAAFKISIYRKSNC
jgi:hypothetical protein